MKAVKTKQKLERIAPRLWRREYLTSTGELSVLYYARFTCRLRKKRRLFALGTNLAIAKEELRVFEARNIRREDFDLTHKKTVTKDSPMTVAEWADKYRKQEGVKDKSSLDADLGMIRLHLVPFCGKIALTEISREMLVRYIDQRMTEKTIRNKKASKKSVARGTVSNELSLLRRMLKVAAREGFQVANPSFEGLIIRVKRGGRALPIEERLKVLELYPRWLAWLAEFATETCVSEGDLLRLTDEMIDRKNRVIVPEGGRLKTQNTNEEQFAQIAPLTDRALEILDEIEAAKKSGAIIRNIKGLIFTREDGRAIRREAISRNVKRAWKKAKIRKFVFHNYRNTALTDWANRNINVDMAMKAAGHTSVQMHKRYLDLQPSHVAKAFGLLENGNTDGRQDQPQDHKQSVTS